MLIRSLILVASLCISQSAAAVCYFEGKAYPTGAIVNNYQCQPDGTWRKVSRQMQLPPRALEAMEMSSPLVRRAYRDDVA
ncbi:MAG TPA: hypothetical protein VGL25_02450 [Casimicrobiaceae bacterium]|jgi:hypothetical protein